MENIQIEIKKLGINGEGIGYYNKKTVFVPYALPNEVVEIEIIENGESFLRGKLVSIIQKSDDRIEPKCEHYGHCGGCTLQHLNYERTLIEKRNLIIEALKKYTKINPYIFEIKKTIGMDNPFYYRNKSQLPCRFDGKVTLGIYKPNSNVLVPIEDCPIQSKNVNSVNSEIVKLMEKFHVKAFDKKKQKTGVRYLVVREAMQTKEIQVTFIVSREMNLNDIASEIIKLDNVKSVYMDINSDIKSKTIFSGNLKKIVGEATIKEKLGNFTFSLLPNAFFQLNTIQTVKLYDEIKKASKLSFKELVVDAYCGVGTIGIWVAKLAKEVVGIESNEEAITSANFNIINNKVKNIKFICDDVLTSFKELANSRQIDVVLLDPPRTGLEEMTKALLEALPKRIVYTSCNSSTLAKDLNELVGKYDIKYIQPIDMFPQTSHVESVTLLELKKS